MYYLCREAYSGAAWGWLDEMPQSLDVLWGQKNLTHQTAFLTIERSD